MDAIEPHSISLLWFTAFATVCAVAFLVVAGMFPLRSRPEKLKSGVTTLLVVSNVVLLVLLLTGTGLYGYAELRRSTLIVVAGLVVLFAPGLFRSLAIVPARWKRRADRIGRNPDAGSRSSGQARRPGVGEYVVIGWEG